MKLLTKLLGTYIAYSWGNLWGTTKKSQSYHISSLCTKLHAFTFPLTPNIFAFWRNNLLSLWRQTVCVRMIVEDSMPSRFQRANFQSLIPCGQQTKEELLERLEKLQKLFFLFKQDTCSSNLIIEKLGENVTKNCGNCNGHNVICFGLQQTVCFSLSFIDRRGSTCHRRYQG